MYTKCIQDGYTGKDRLELGKDRLGKDSEDNGDNIFDFIEQNFGRTLNPTEIELISQWEDNELTRYAIKQAILNGVYNFKYINTILNSYKNKNIKTVQQAEQEHQNFINKRQKKTETVPEWFNENIEEQQVNNEEINKLEERLKKYK